MIPKWFDRTPPVTRPWLIKIGFNWLPAWRGSGARVIEVSRDLRRMVVALPLNRRTRNGVGTTFGGSLFAATDGPYPGLLKLALGRDVVVWDKAGAIRYRKPGRSTLFAEFALDDAEIAAVRALITRNGECERTYVVDLKDRHGIVHTTVERTVYIASKQHYARKRAA